jgi:ubiquinone/menaquinone biosynthesis C-methylase UbiE
MTGEADIRHTGRSLERYRTYFGQELGIESELILDVGAGYSQAGATISESFLFDASVVRIDNIYHLARPYATESAPAIAASALALPFKNQAFDRVISSWLPIHFKHEDCAMAVEEMLRVVKDGHEVMVRPVSPFGSLNDTIARRYRDPLELLPLTMIITKPEEFSDWESDHRREVCRGLASYIVWDKWRKVFR